MACTEADFEHRPCARENYAKLVRGAFLPGPRKFVRKMCGRIRKCAEIVRNLCGGWGWGCTCTICAEYWGGASENVRAQIWRKFSLKLEFFSETKLYGQKMSQAWVSGRVRNVYVQHHIENCQSILGLPSDLKLLNGEAFVTCSWSCFAYS